MRFFFRRRTNPFNISSHRETSFFHDTSVIDYEKTPFLRLFRVNAVYPDKRPPLWNSSTVPRRELASSRCPEGRRTVSSLLVIPSDEVTLNTRSFRTIDLDLALAWLPVNQIDRTVNSSDSKSKISKYTILYYAYTISKPVKRSDLDPTTRF